MPVATPQTKPASTGYDVAKPGGKCAVTGNPINPDNLRRDYVRLVKLAGVPRIRIHDQRHTHASLMLQMGTDIKVVSERLGHARTSTTVDIYHHVTSRQHVEAGDRIGAALFGPAAEGVV